MTSIVVTKKFTSEIVCIITPVKGKVVLHDRTYTKNDTVNVIRVECRHCGYVMNSTDYRKEIDGVMPNIQWTR